MGNYIRFTDKEGREIEYIDFYPYNITPVDAVETVRDFMKETEHPEDVFEVTIGDTHTDFLIEPLTKPVEFFLPKEDKEKDKEK